MLSWTLWTQSSVLAEIRDIKPQLASWEKKTDPAQIRLQSYLNDVSERLAPLPDQSNLFLHMIIDVEDPAHLLHHYDLENYLTPVVHKLGHQRFVYVSADKQVGEGSRIIVGVAGSGQQPEKNDNQWRHFSCAAGAGAQSKSWKEGIRSQLDLTQPEPLPPGMVEVQLAWRCSSQRNWIWLWKPTGDAMGPVLGCSDSRNPFNPNDDRIVSLHLHLNKDDRIGHNIDVGMWWRPSAS